MINKKNIFYILIFTFVLTIIVYKIISCFILPKSTFNKYVLDFIKEKYDNYKSYKYMGINKCRDSGGVWFPHDIEMCYVSTYEITTKTHKFNIYVTNDHHSQVFIYIADSDNCKDLDGFYYDVLTSKYSECVKKLK